MVIKTGIIPNHLLFGVRMGEHNISEISARHYGVILTTNVNLKKPKRPHIRDGNIK